MPMDKCELIFSNTWCRSRRGNEILYSEVILDVVIINVVAAVLYHTHSLPWLQVHQHHSHSRFLHHYICWYVTLSLSTNFSICFAMFGSQSIYSSAINCSSATFFWVYCDVNVTIVKVREIEFISRVVLMHHGLMINFKTTSWAEMLAAHGAGDLLKTLTIQSELWFDVVKLIDGAITDAFWLGCPQSVPCSVRLDLS